MDKPLVDYKKYRWFFTASGKLVVGGKSSAQNDELLKKFKRSKHDYVVMHTSRPSSPFSIIFAEKSDVSESDIEEVAIFTACFSRQWKEGKKMAEIDIFSLSRLYKLGSMKTGTWGVKGKIGKKTVPLELVLTKQNEKLRAVPEKTVKNKKDIFLKIIPGKVDKSQMLPKLQVEMAEHVNQEELLSALPAGGVAISRK